jgi:hypothetical protein
MSTQNELPPEIQQMQHDAEALVDQASRLLKQANALSLGHQYRIARFERVELQDTPFPMICNVDAEDLQGVRLRDVEADDDR